MRIHGSLRVTPGMAAGITDHVWDIAELVDAALAAPAAGKPVKHDRRRYKRRNRIEIMFGRLKDWRRVATRYDRCPKVFLSAVALAATVTFRR